MGMGDGGGNDAYVQLAYKIGGAPFDRRQEKPAEALTAGAEFWRDDSTTLSLFGYTGCAPIRAVGTDGTVMRTTTGSGGSAPACSTSSAT